MSPLLLAAIGVIPPMSLGTMALVTGTAVVFDGSLGTNGLSYPNLYKYLLPIRGMRVPARFAALVGTGLILLAAYGVRRVLRVGRTSGQKTALLMLIAAGALVDLRSDVELRPYFSTVPSIYSAVTPDMVLAELPMEGAANFTYMYFSTFHWARLVNGQSGYMPASYTDLEQDMEDFPRGRLIERLRERHTTHLTVNCALFPEPWRCGELLAAIERMPELQLVTRGWWEGAEVRLYRLR